MRFLLIALGCSILAPQAAQAAVFDRPAVADDELGRMRGGFATPGGLDVAIAIDTITSVNGVPLLQSIFKADRGPAELTVLAADGQGGLSQIDATGAPVPRGGGTVSAVQSGDRGAQITFTASELMVRHLAGGAYGSIIANRADNSTIDSVSAVNLQVRNASALTVGPSLLRADAIAVDVATALIR